MKKNYEVFQVADTQLRNFQDDTVHFFSVKDRYAKKMKHYHHCL